MNLLQRIFFSNFASDLLVPQLLLLLLLFGGSSTIIAGIELLSNANSFFQFA